VTGWVSAPQRIWLRHSLRAGAWTAGLLVSLMAAAALGSHHDRTLALLAIAVGLFCLGLAWYEHRLARRGRIGARSERIVRGALRNLEREGWTIRHSVRWPDGGDIDHVAVAPSGLAFAIETKTRRYEFEHLERTRACAEWVGCRWHSRGGVYAVLCVTRAPTRCDVEHGVIVVSVDRLVDALVSTAASGAPQTARRPASVLQAIARWVGA
jgi:hypothetical protein